MSLISVSQFCASKSSFFKFYDQFFIVKDNRTKTPLIRKLLLDGLYRFPFSSPLLSSSTHIGFKVLLNCWHLRLGYLALPMVSQIVCNNHLPFSPTQSSTVCPNCLLAKTHHHPFSSSSHSQSTGSLQLIWADVWGIVCRGCNKWWLINPTQIRHKINKFEFDVNEFESKWVDPLIYKLLMGQ